ncbi:MULTISPECIES: hypothetical protein [Vitreoscilla]|uniref:Uncharacterized protein n=1 Tax=Vitreoscilla stercoraria TaxID=61 RepID=A0ABY4EBG6_VITST|nr:MULTISPECIES: hypothetical protein [Vitreoscilla]AUZ05980.1 hypothetical protein ADP71_27040 [Vitreoscilla sp. C1]UOO92646.1 hypothetical protein LVJ81_00940 [Vitreoscilla stercoraria]
MKASLLVVYLFHNEVKVLASDQKAWNLALAFAHPRSLVGNVPILEQGLRLLLQDYWHEQTYLQRYVGVQKIVWVLPPQIGGLSFLELRVLKELSHVLLGGRMYAYVIESEPLNYAYWQAKIPTLKRL